MPPQRPKRLPTDFFDRLLSNQTDDQINDLLSSLVDEQIAPTTEPEPEQASTVTSSPYGAEETTPPVRSMQYGAFEDSIVTRDEELSEPLADETATSMDELIPPTAKMRTQGAIPEVEETISEPTPLPQVPEMPSIPEQPVTLSEEQPRQSVPEVPTIPDSPAMYEVEDNERISFPGAEAIEVPPELFGEPKSSVTPPEPEPEQPAASPPAMENPVEQSEPVWNVETSETREPSFQESVAQSPTPPEEDNLHLPVSEELEDMFSMSETETISAVPEVEQMPEPIPVVEPEEEGTVAAEAPVVVPEKEHVLTHKELVLTRTRVRQQRSRIRKPKLPKLAKASPPITVDQTKISALDDYLMTKQKEKLSLHLSRVHRAAIWFILPAFVAFSLFSWYPMLKGLFLSFFNFQPTGESLFIGFQNYTRAFNDAMFWQTMTHAGLFCGLALLLGFMPPLFLSIFINEIKRGKNFIKFLFFLPFLMPTVPAAILWKWIMDQGFGLLNAIMAMLPIADPHIGWLTDPKLAMLSIVLLYIWKNTGWAILIYSAALVHIDPTLYEEAEIQGASIWHKMRLVTFPALRGVIGVMLIITIINTLQLFTEVYIMTNGGPMNSTEVIATYIYKQAFFYMDIGYASALSILMLFMILVITMFRLRRLEPDGG